MDGFMYGVDVPEDDLRAIDKEMRYLWFFWVGVIGTFPVFVAMILVAGEKLGGIAQVDENLVDLLSVIFLVVAIVTVAVSVLLRKQFFCGKLQFFTNCAVEAQPGKPAYLAKFEIGKFICITIPGAAGPMGFLLFVLGGDILLFGLFMLIGTCGVIYHRPSRAEIIEYYQKCHSDL